MNSASTSHSDILQALTDTLRSRKGADPADSYVASLYAAGLNRILEKVGEEAVEVVLAAKDAGSALAAGPAAEEVNQTRKALAGEVADLWFHTLVMLVHLDMDPATVLDVLARRFGISGHAEKAART